MRDEPFNLPALRFPVRGYTSRAGALAWGLLRAAAAIVLVAGRVLLVVVLHLTRPFIVWPLLLGTAAGMGVTAGFALSGMWHDAARAGLVTFAAAAALGLYSRLVQMLDPEHHDRVPLRHRRF